MRIPRGAVALSILALGAAGDPPDAHADPPVLNLQDEIRDGDEQCTNLCDRYAFVWEPGTEVELRLTTDGFAAYMNIDGPAVHEVTDDPGREVSTVFVTTRSTPYTVLINSYNYYDRGHYRLQVSPRPIRYLAPAVRPFVAPLAPEEQETDEIVLRTADSLAAGARLSGREVRGTLDRLPGLRFAAKRGRCYRAVLVLDADARWTRQGTRPPAPAATVVRMDVHSAREARGTVQTAHSTARVVALDDELCPSSNGTLEITFQDRSRLTPVVEAGVGGFVARLYERTISTRELDVRDAEEGRLACAACMQQRAGCQRTGNAGAALTCADQFRECVDNAGLSNRTCAP